MNEPNERYIQEHVAHREFYLNRDFPGFLEMLNELYPNINSLGEKLWLRLHGYDGYKKCPICGQDVKTFKNFNQGFTTYCSPTCAQMDPQVRLKNHNTNVERYGDNYRKKQNTKTLQTKLKKYGCSSYNNKEKYKQTCLDKYGVDNPTKLESIKNKIVETNLKKYGAPYKILTKEYRNNYRKTLDKKLIEKHPEIIDIRMGDDNLPIFTCKCQDKTCNLCSNKTYEIGYYMFYERKYIYKTELCSIKNPHNANKGTFIELFVRNILDTYNIHYIENDRKILQGKELDIYIPKHKLAIECNGIYWHQTGSESRIEPTYHFNKWKECKDQDIQLLTIWEDQIYNKPEIVEGIIKSHLGIYDHQVGARKCILKEVSSKESNKFLNENHLQGSANGSIRLGLYYNDELVSIMVFGAKRRALGNKETNENTYELYRYCNKLGWQIQGGASRLFKHFIDSHEDSLIESFSSNDISMGDLYKKLGFKLIDVQKGSYWYIDRKRNRHHRYSFRKDILVKEGYDPNKTEFEITEEIGLMRIYDSGQQKWIYHGRK